jgi:Sushi repeat (SCR repeat)
LYLTTDAKKMLCNCRPLGILLPGILLPSQLIHTCIFLIILQTNFSECFHDICRIALFFLMKLQFFSGGYSLFTEEFEGCLPLPGIPHGALFGLAADGRYRVGARVAYTCQPGFRLRGTPVFSCESSGCWEPALLPDCTPEEQPFYRKLFFN